MEVMNVLKTTQRVYFSVYNPRVSAAQILDVISIIGEYQRLLQNKFLSSLIEPLKRRWKGSSRIAIVPCTQGSKKKKGKSKYQDPNTWPAGSTAKET